MYKTEKKLKKKHWLFAKFKVSKKTLNKHSLKRERKKQLNSVCKSLVYMKNLMI